MQGEALLDIRKRPSPIEKGVSLISKYNYLYPPLPPSPILLAVFTPLSIRRGGGGEAFLYLQTMVFTPLSIRRGGGGEACCWLVIGFPWVRAAPVFILT